MDLISGREAARLLAPLGLSHSASQHLLATGIAGRPVVAGGVHGFGRGEVKELARRPSYERAELSGLFDNGIVLLRLARTAHLDVRRSWAAAATLIRGPWSFGGRQLAAAQEGARRDGGLPVAVLAAGFVIAGATVVRLRSTAAGVLLDLEPPGIWIESMRFRRITGGKGTVDVVRPTVRPRPLRDGDHLQEFGVVGGRGWDQEAEPEFLEVLESDPDWDDDLRADGPVTQADLDRWAGAGRTCP